MPVAKRRKLSEEEASQSADDNSPSDADSAQPSGIESSPSEPDTEDEIADLKHQKSKKTLKRKHRATTSTNFGSALQSLLDIDAPSGVPLSLKPSVAQRRNREKLESKARKVIQVEKKEEEDKNRIKNVIGGWGTEGERALRKVAQRGGQLSQSMCGRVYSPPYSRQALQRDSTSASICCRGH